MICFDLNDDGSLTGGSHTIFSLDYGRAIVVQDCGEGVVLLGDYRRVLHANSATRAGRRLIVTAYVGQSLVDKVAEAQR